MLVKLLTAPVLLVLLNTRFSYGAALCNNQIAVTDCGGENALVSFKNVVVRTFDERGDPSCHNGQANARTPGYIQLAPGGSVEVKTDLAIDGLSFAALTLEKNGAFRFCDAGKATLPIHWMQHLCHAKFCWLLCRYVPEHCHICETLSHKGTHTVADLPAGLQAKIRIPDIKGVLQIVTQGVWGIEAKLMIGEQQVGCIKNTQIHVDEEN